MGSTRDIVAREVQQAQAALASARWTWRCSESTAPPDRIELLGRYETLRAAAPIAQLIEEVNAGADAGASSAPGAIGLAREAARLRCELRGARPIGSIESLSRVRLELPAGYGITTSFARADDAISMEARRGARYAIEDARERLLYANRGPLSDRAAAQTEALTELLGTDGAEAAARLMGRSADDVRAQAERILAVTDDAWADVSAWFLSRWLGVERAEARPADVTCLLSLPELHRSWPGGGARLAAARTGGELGLWPCNVRVATGAADVSPGPLVVAVDPPHDVRLAFVASPADGLASYAAALAAVGAAVASRAVHEDAGVEARTILLGSPGALAGALLGSLAYERQWQRRVMATDHGPDERRAIALGRLGGMRLRAAQTLGSLAIAKEGPGEAAREEATDAWRRALGVPPEPFRWLHRFDPLLDSVVSLEQDARAEAWAAQLKERFDEEWYRVPEAGRHLRDSMSHGGALTATAAGIPEADPTAMARSALGSLD